MLLPTAAEVSGSSGDEALVIAVYFVYTCISERERQIGSAGLQQAGEGDESPRWLSPSNVVAAALPLVVHSCCGLPSIIHRKFTSLLYDTIPLPI